MYRKALLRFTLFALPVAAAVAAFMTFVGNREAPPRVERVEESTPVRIKVATPGPFVPTVSGYGVVEPARTFDAVTQVSGAVARIHPRLSVGELLQAGAEIAVIETSDYEMAVARSEAQLAVARARLAELRAQEENARASRGIEARSLSLSRTETQRQRELVARGTASQSTLDTAERDLLAQESRLQDIENTLRILPAQIEAQESEVAAAEVDLDQARRDLARTLITLPFDARISEAEVETGEYVGVGSVLARFDSIGVAEVSARLPQGSFMRFVSLTAPEDLAPMDVMETEAPRDVLASLGWSATVVLGPGVDAPRWEAQVVRTENGIDPETRSVGLVVAVEEPYRGARLGTRPPLVKGMFVTVILEGPALPDALALPRGAVRALASGDPHVLVADAADRLTIVPVRVRAIQSDEVLLAPQPELTGARVVLSELTTVIEGQLLAPVDEAGGEASAAEVTLLDAAPEAVEP